MLISRCSECAGNVPSVGGEHSSQAAGSGAPYTETTEILHWYQRYRKVSNIRRTLVGNKIVDHSDVVEASSPVGAAPTTSSFST